MRVQPRICNWFSCRSTISSPIREYCLVHTKVVAALRRTLKSLDPDEVIKDKARQLAFAYKRRGKLVQLPCEQCGSAKSEMHHPDYNQPLFIIWLCRTCHSRLHRQPATTI